MNTAELVACMANAHRQGLGVSGVAPDFVFVVPGPPVGYQRMGGRSKATPKKTRDYMEHVASCVRIAQAFPIAHPQNTGRSGLPFVEWLYVDVWIYCPKTRNGNHPDADNVQKSIHDGAAGILWSAGTKRAKDDRHVMGRCQGFACGDSMPRVEVAVTLAARLDIIGHMANGIRGSE